MGSPAAPSPRPPRWLLPLGWAVAAALAGLHAAVEGDYRRLLGELGVRPGADTPLRQVVPARYADAQIWVRHALEQPETGVVRLRFTPADDAPAERALERALGWFNLPLLALVLVGWSAWLSRGAGLAAGLVLAAGIVGHSRFYEGFAPANVDHHGLINAGLLGLGRAWRELPAFAKPTAGRLRLRQGSHLRRGYGEQDDGQDGGGGLDRSRRREGGIAAAAWWSWGLPAPVSTDESQSGVGIVGEWARLRRCP
ncbi:MAG: hypothetical protein FJ381_01885 [Verrucomicrobia bacterium]|nr:hypothetical protein [Verrucomicrobiota bacterium]